MNYVFVLVSNRGFIGGVFTTRPAAEAAQKNFESGTDLELFPNDPQWRISQEPLISR